MLRKVGVAGAVVGAALGAVLMAGPAQAGEHTDQSNDNVQLVPIQLCNTNIAILGVNQSESGDCVNGPQQANIDK